MNNRNHQNGRRVDRSSAKNSKQQNGYNILPSSRVLESYEATSPGSVNKLLDMARKEQEHRHNWQDRYLARYTLTYRMGQIFGFVFGVGLLYLMWILVKHGDGNLALKIFTVSAILIVIALLVTFRERRINNSRPLRRINDRRKRENKKTIGYSIREGQK